MKLVRFVTVLAGLPLLVQICLYVSARFSGLDSMMQQAAFLGFLMAACGIWFTISFYQVAAEALYERPVGFFAPAAVLGGLTVPFEGIVYGAALTAFGFLAFWFASGVSLIPFFLHNLGAGVRSEVQSRVEMYEGLKARHSHESTKLRSRLWRHNNN